MYERSGQEMSGPNKWRKYTAKKLCLPKQKEGFSTDNPSQESSARWNLSPVLEREVIPEAKQNRC